VEEVLDIIYAAAVDPARWGEALQSIVLFCGVTGGAIYAPRLPGVPLTGVEKFLRYTPWSPDIPGLFEAFAHQDCFSASMLDLVGGDHRKVATVMGVRPTAQQLNSAYYQEYMRAMNIGDTMALMLRAPRAGRATPVLGLQSRWGCAPISRAQVGRLQALAPHLQRAARLLLEVAPDAPVDPALRQSVETAATPMLLLRDDGGLACANAVAEGLATAGRGLTLAAGRLTALDPQVNGRLQGLFRRALQSGPGEGRSGGEMDVEGPDGARITCLVLPLGGDNPFRDGVGPCRAVVYLLAPGQDPAHGAQRLRRLFGLSAAETEVAIALMGGGSAEEIALERGRSIETVRTQCRAILSKTGLGRATELARLRPLVTLAEVH